MHAWRKHPKATLVVAAVCLLRIGASISCGRGPAIADPDAAVPQVVINELHTNPDIKTELVEFIELYNYGSVAVDLSGWSFTEGVFYTFPAGAMLPAGGYVVVAQNPEQLNAKFGTERVGLPAGRVFGPYGGTLDNDAERVVMCDADGRFVDDGEYDIGRASCRERV